MSFPYSFQLPIISLWEVKVECMMKSRELLLFRFDVRTPEPEIKADSENVDDNGVPEGKRQDRA